MTKSRLLFDIKKNSDLIINCFTYVCIGDGGVLYFEETDIWLCAISIGYVALTVL